MNTTDNHPISDELLQAFVDGQLDAKENGRILKTLKTDSALNKRACELRHLHELISHAYEQIPPYKTREKSSGDWGTWRHAAAASFLLAVGALLGWIGHSPENTPAAGPDLSAMYWDKDRSFHNTDVSDFTNANSPTKIIVHLNTSSSEKFETALDTTAQLLESYKGNTYGAQIEVVANASAIKMLRSGHSPVAQRVRALQQQYINLTFLACQTAIDHAIELEGQDSSLELLPNVDVTPSALEHILNRLSDGWLYLNV